MLYRGRHVDRRQLVRERDGPSSAILDVTPLSGSPAEMASARRSGGRRGSARPDGVDLVRPTRRHHCVGALSAGPGAMSSSGFPAFRNDFTVEVTARCRKPGFFYYSTTQSMVPMATASGRGRDIGAAARDELEPHRAQQPPRRLHRPSPPAALATILPGSTWNSPGTATRAASRTSISRTACPCRSRREIRNQVRFFAPRFRSPPIVSTRGEVRKNEPGSVFHGPIVNCSASVRP